MCPSFAISSRTIPRNGRMCQLKKSSNQYFYRLFFSDLADFLLIYSEISIYTMYIFKYDTLRGKASWEYIWSCIYTLFFFSCHHNTCIVNIYIYYYSHTYNRINMFEVTVLKPDNQVFRIKWFDSTATTTTTATSTVPLSRCELAVRAIEHVSHSYFSYILVFVYYKYYVCLMCLMRYTHTERYTGTHALGVWPRITVYTAHSLATGIRVNKSRFQCKHSIHTYIYIYSPGLCPIVRPFNTHIRCIVFIWSYLL